MFRLPQLLALVWIVLAAHAARADIIVEFYSQDFGRNFPHAFLKAKGKWNKNDRAVDDTFGFTAKSLSPAILVGPVPGDFEPIAKHALAVSKLRFSIVANDEQYMSLLAVVRNWRKNPGANYDLNTHNCVYFVGEAAQALGLKVTFQKTLMKSPSKFLINIAQLNPQLSKSPLARTRMQKPTVRTNASAKTPAAKVENAGPLY